MDNFELDFSSVLMVVSALVLVGSVFYKKLIARSAKERPAEPVARSELNSAQVYKRRIEERTVAALSEPNQQARAWIEEGMIEKAVSYFEQSAQFGEGILCLEEKGQYTAAASLARRWKGEAAAAEIFARHGLHRQAAEHYVAAKEFEHAAQIYVHLAASNFRYFKQVGDCYYAAGEVELALRAYAELAMSDRILKICRMHSHYRFLGEYMHLGIHAKQILPRLNGQDFEALVQALSLSPGSADILASWLNSCPKLELALPLLRRLSYDEDCACEFWQYLSPQLIAQLSEVFTKRPDLLKNSEYRIHATALGRIGREDLAKLFTRLALSPVAAS